LELKAPTYNQLSKIKIFINEKLETPLELPKLPLIT